MNEWSRFLPPLPFIFVKILGTPPGDNDNQWQTCEMKWISVKSRNWVVSCAWFLLTGLPTPAEDDVPDEVLLQGEEGAAHQGEQEVTLRQQPAVVCQDGVVGEHQHHLTRHLRREGVLTRHSRLNVEETKSDQWAYFFSKMSNYSFLFDPRERVERVEKSGTTKRPSVCTG